MIGGRVDEEVKVLNLFFLKKVMLFEIEYGVFIIVIWGSDG